MASYRPGGPLAASDKAEFETLLVAVAQRDRAAFRTLYDLASPKLYATILRIVRSKAAAEEIMQDVFLRIWQKAESFSPDAGPARAWMNSIARNRAIDVLRQKTFTQLAVGEDGTDMYERVAEDRDREADMINNASLRHCLDTIDEPARVCVLLAYYEGYSREELAQRYDRPVNTIKTWLHRSLATLRVCLDGAA
jgi:RNA polymerase sigma factor (sigma-70 family)